MNNNISLTFLLLAISVARVFAGAPTTITECQSILSPGNYTFSTVQSNVSGPCIVIGAPNVTITGGSITSTIKSQAVRTIGISVQATSAVFSSFAIIDFSIGIELSQGSDGCSISVCGISSTGVNDVVVVGISIFNSTNHTIGSSTIGPLSSNRSLPANSSASFEQSGIGVVGINASFSSGLTVQGNLIQNLTGISGAVPTVNLVFEGGPAVGMSLWETTVSTVSGNLFSYLQGGAGCIGVSCNLTTLTKITDLYHCGAGGWAVGIYLRSNSVGNTITGNVIAGLTGGLPACNSLNEDTFGAAFVIESSSIANTLTPPSMAYTNLLEQSPIVFFHAVDSITIQSIAVQPNPSSAPVVLLGYGPSRRTISAGLVMINCTGTNLLSNVTISNLLGCDGRLSGNGTADGCDAAAIFVDGGGALTCSDVNPVTILAGNGLSSNTQTIGNGGNAWGMYLARCSHVNISSSSPDNIYGGFGGWSDTEQPGSGGDATGIQISDVSNAASTSILSLQWIMAGQCGSNSTNSGSVPRSTGTSTGLFLSNIPRVDLLDPPAFFLVHPAAVSWVANASAVISASNASVVYHFSITFNPNHLTSAGPIQVTGASPGDTIMLSSDLPCWYGEGYSFNLQANLTIDVSSLPSGSYYLCWKPGGHPVALDAYLSFDWEGPVLNVTSSTSSSFSVVSSTSTASSTSSTTSAAASSSTDVTTTTTSSSISSTTSATDTISTSSTTTSTSSTSTTATSSSTGSTTSSTSTTSSSSSSSSGEDEDVVPTVSSFANVSITEQVIISVVTKTNITVATVRLFASDLSDGTNQSVSFAVTVSPVNASDIPLSSYQVISKVFDIVVIDTISGSVRSTFSRSVEIDFDRSNLINDSSTIDPSSLRLAYIAGSQWLIESNVTIQGNIVSGFTSHFTSFAIVVDPSKPSSHQSSPTPGNPESTVEIIVIVVAVAVVLVIVPLFVYIHVKDRKRRRRKARRNRSPRSSNQSSSIELGSGV